MTVDTGSVTTNHECQITLWCHEMVKEAISKMDENCRELLTYVSDGKSESEIQEIFP